MNRTPTAAASLLALAAMLSLAGCSDAAPSPSPSTTATASTKPGAATLEKLEGACTDGIAEVTRNNAEVTIAGDCAEVDVAATNTLVHVGAVETLTVTGSISKVQASRVAKIVFRGDGNIVVAPGESAVEDHGKDNKHIAG